MTPSFSMVINHTPWRPERGKALAEMLEVAVPKKSPWPLHAYIENDVDLRGRDWQGGAKLQWQLAQWLWSARIDVSHHIFMTDDLHLAPGFLGILSAMVQARPEAPIGLLSNHPDAVGVYDAGHHGYRTASWLVGPAYVIPHELMAPFLAWYMHEPDDRLRGPRSWNDDNAWNEWIAKRWKGATWHPLPTIVEHRADLESTVGHGDHHSRERLSWRERRHVRWIQRAEDASERFEWVSEPWEGPSLEAMKSPDFWAGPAPLLRVGE